MPEPSIRIASILIALVLLITATRHLSSTPRVEDAMTPVQGADRYVPDTHVAYYQAHLATLGIDRMNCK